MAYQRINLELVVFADEADAIVAELMSSIDKVGATYSVFGGEVERGEFKPSETQNRSALMHTIRAAGMTADGMKLAAGKVAQAYKKLI